MATLCEIKSSRASLVSLPIFFFGILSIEDLVPAELLVFALIVVGRVKIELVVDNGIYPLAV